MKWTIAGHTIPCYECLNVDYKRRTAHYVYCPGHFMCKTHWDWFTRGKISQWNFDNDELQEWERLETEETAMYEDCKDEPIDPEIINIAKNCIFKPVFKEMGIDLNVDEIFEKTFGEGI